MAGNPVRIGIWLPVGVLHAYGARLKKSRQLTSGAELAGTQQRGARESARAKGRGGALLAGRWKRVAMLGWGAAGSLSRSGKWAEGGGKGSRAGPEEEEVEEWAFEPNRETEGFCCFFSFFIPNPFSKITLKYF